MGMTHTPPSQARTTLRQLLALDPTNRPALDLKAQVEHGNVQCPQGVDDAQHNAADKT